MLDSSSGELIRLARLLADRNAIDQAIGEIIGRPALAGHIGEHVAAHIFDIGLQVSAVEAGSDGFFRSGPLSGRSVNIKCFARRDGFLDINPVYLPDDYLVLCGPSITAMTSRGQHRPFRITQVFLFNAAELVTDPRTRGVGIGVATSLRKQDWEAAEIFPDSKNPRLVLDPTRRRLIDLFA